MITRRRTRGTLTMALLGAALVTVVGIAAGGGSPVASAPLGNRRPPPAPTLTDDPRERPPPGPIRAADDSLLLILRIFVILCLLALVIAIVVIVVRLFLDPDDGRPVIEVSDTGTGHPTVQPQNYAATSGRGLQLMAELVHEWGVKRLAGDREVVWAKLP